MKSQTQPNDSTAPEDVFVYRGISNKGKVQLVHNGRRAIVTGKVYRLNPLASGKKKLLLVHVTNGYTAASSIDLRIIAIDSAKVKYRVIGQIQYEPESMNSKEPHPFSSSCISSSANKEVQHSESVRAYLKTLEFVLTQKALGHDPYVRIDFAAEFVGESKSNLYKKIGKTFPRPVKRGRASFWLFSDVESYIHGSFEVPELRQSAAL